MSIGMGDYAYSYVENTRMENISTAKLVAKSGGSYLVAIAVLLGAVADKMADNLLELGKQLGEKQEDNARTLKAGGIPDKVSENHLTGLLTAQGQLMNTFMQAMNTALKSVGEGNTAVARKQ